MAGLHPHQAVLTTPTSRLLVTASHTTLSVFNLAVGTHVASATPHKALIRILASHLSASDNQEYLITSGEDKLLNVLSLPALTLLSTRELTKRANAIEITDDGEIVVGDKFGDVYRYPLVAPASPVPVLEKEKGKAAEKQLPIMGHVSMLNALAIIPPESSGTKSMLIATGDRDEHVRLSRYPDAYIIENHLWGSNSFVASLLHLPSSSTSPDTPALLLSAGGDSSIQVFNLFSGELLNQIAVEELLLPLVLVAPTAPQVTLSSKPKGKRNNKGKGKELEKQSGEVVAESELAKEDASMPEATKAEQEAEKELQRIRTLGPHAWKDGVTTGLAIVKLVKFGHGVVVLAAGASALLYIPLSHLLSSTDTESASAPITTLDLHRPILDISLTAASSVSSTLPEFYVTLDMSRGSSEALSAVRTVTLAADSSSLVLGEPSELESLVAEKAVPLSASLAFPSIPSLYPALSLLIITPEPGEDDPSEPLDGDGSATPAPGIPKSKKRPSSELLQEKPERKKGKRHDARDKLAEDLKSYADKGKVES